MGATKRHQHRLPPCVKLHAVERFQQRVAAVPRSVAVRALALVAAQTPPVGHRDEQYASAQWCGVPYTAVLVRGMVVTVWRKER